MVFGADGSLMDGSRVRRMSSRGEGTAVRRDPSIGGHPLVEEDRDPFFRVVRRKKNPPLPPLDGVRGGEGFANERGAEACRLRVALVREGFKGRESEGVGRMAPRWSRWGGASGESPSGFVSPRRGRAARLARGPRARRTWSWIGPFGVSRGIWSGASRRSRRGSSWARNRFDRYRTQKVDCRRAWRPCVPRGGFRPPASSRRRFRTASLYAEGATLARDLVKWRPERRDPARLGR
jgi:hypothetical protein